MHHTTKALLSTVVLACAWVNPPSSWGADENGRFAIRGVGAEACETLTALLVANNQSELSTYTNWLMGYVSAFNRLSERTFDALPTLSGTDLLGATAVLCRDNSDMRFGTAASQALEALLPVRLTQETSVVVLEYRDRSTSIREESIIALGDQLKNLGHLGSSWSGEASTDLFEAIEGFQAEEGLNVTGLPDIDTLLRASVRAN